MLFSFFYIKIIYVPVNWKMIPLGADREKRKTISIESMACLLSAERACVLVWGRS